MGKRKVGIRLLNDKNTRIFIGDSIKNTNIVLNKIARKNGWQVESKPDNKEGKLIGWYYEISDFCRIHINDEDVVDEITVSSLSDHDIECDKQLYDYDNLNKAGFEVIQSKSRDVLYSLDDIDIVMNDSSKKNERAIIFGNDKTYRIGFVINAVNDHLTSMVIKKYGMEYPFNSYEETKINW